MCVQLFIDFAFHYCRGRGGERINTHTHLLEAVISHETTALLSYTQKPLFFFFGLDFCFVTLIFLFFFI